MAKVESSPLELKLEYLFKQHDTPLPRNLRSSLCGLVANEAMRAAGGGHQNLRDIKLPPRPQEIEGFYRGPKRDYHD